MVALNEKFSHSGNLVSGGQLSPQVIEDFDFTESSEEVHGGSVVNFGGAGFRGLSDASPSRRRSAAPVNRSGPETQLYYVRNRMYNPALGRWVQRDPIGYSGGINLYEYVGGRAVGAIDSTGEFCCTDQCSDGACPRFLGVKFRKRSCLYHGSGASGIAQGLRNFDKYFYLPGTVAKWPAEPDVVPGAPIGAITRAGRGIGTGLEKLTGVYVEGVMEYEACGLRPCMGVLTQWAWLRQESPEFVFPVCVEDTVPAVAWAEAWLLYVLRRGYFPLLSASICGQTGG